LSYEGEKNKMQQILNETLSEIADLLVSTGIYQDPTKALLAIAIDFIDRKFENYQNIVRYYEQKYNSNLKDYANQIENRASMQQEIDYEEWEIADGMLNDWQEAKRKIVANH
jgi:CRISPR/Cas system-associated endonuclease Cas1